MILTGIVSSAALRALLPVTFLLIVGFALGVQWPGLLGLGIAIFLVAALAAAAALYASTLAVHFGTQQAAPLMQIGTFVAVLFTTAYAPLALLSPWLRKIAELNPVTKVLEGVRQGFVGGVTWVHTWEALVAVTGLTLVFGALALRSMRRFAE